MYQKSSFFLLFALCGLLSKAQSTADTTDRIADSIVIADHHFSSSKLPKPLKVVEPTGVATFSWVEGKVIHHARSRKGGLFECRATVTPKGDYLLMFPDGGHYGQSSVKTNDMLAYRSSDRGKTWTGPTIAFDIDYNQHGFIPFIPKNSNRIYAFGTQPIFGMYTRENGQQENAPIGYRYSDDDGYHWSEVRIIKPVNDPGFRGMSVMRMTETDRGTWLLGSHEGDWSYKPLITRQYLLRSEDQGKTWELLPGKRHGGWFARCFDRMDEGRPINIGNDSVLFMIRTPEGHLWSSYSKDDGKTWTNPSPTPLVHPDAPPMLYKLSDNKTLIEFFHNENHDLNYTGLSGTKKEIMMDRSELWFSLSTDDGKTWSEPRFLLVNALAPTYSSPFRNYQCSYIDMFADNGELHIFIPHRWERVLYLHFKESDLKKFPTRAELFANR
ncbi:MAG TPA: sialidase family protein [Puia sp.]|nr:sialidase family protein [Puia sp.]